MHSFKGTIRILTAIPSYNGAVHFPEVIAWSDLILPMHFFSVFQNTSHCETNFFLNPLYFQSTIEYIEMRTANWSSYFFAFFQNT